MSAAKQGKPYNFNENVLYTLQLLKNSRKRMGWVVVDRGLPTLERLRKWRQIISNWNQSFRIGQRLPNGVYRYAFCGTDPMAWILAGIRYLEVNKNDTSFIKLFTKEQRIALISIFERILDIHYFHADDEEKPHQDQILLKIEASDVKLRNHRHDTTKTYSAKAEF